MALDNHIDCDVLVIGAGFAGSLTALCLHQAGFSVCVVEKEQHPRFAIGESSTPIADMILRDLSDDYDLPWLKHFSRYGSWQRHYPGITCGLKRGFSYFKHEAGKEFETNTSHKNELLVAASVSDEQSDTNWLRADFDAFLADKLRDYEIAYFDRTEITGLKRSENWKVTAVRNTRRFSIAANFFIDATGNSGLLHRFLHINSNSNMFRTNSRAIFSHFTGLKKWESYLTESGIPTIDYPYRSDYSALHHLLDDAWMWMLRFNDDRCSAGIMLDRNNRTQAENTTPQKRWKRTLKEYPSIRQLFRKAEYAEPPGRLVQTKRLQRRLEQAAGTHWAALPHTAGFVDPMHSTGIAHTLAGIEKLLHILRQAPGDDQKRRSALQEYQQSLFDELAFIDTLVAGSYRALGHFPLFNTYVMLYFIAAINYEQQRLKGERPAHFLSAGHPEIRNIIDTSYKDLKILLEGEPTGQMIEAFRHTVRKRIRPFNKAGLMNSNSNNMYHHTAVAIE